MFNILRSAIFAGVCIGIAGFGFLAGKELGMILFIFGLATVVSYKLKLFTGTAGFVQTGHDMLELSVILVGNLLGCLLVALAARCSAMPLCDTAEQVLSSRLSIGPLRAGTLSIGCGILMTTAVNFARKGKEIGNWIPLLFAVPLFIHCGFPHCIADAFYYMTAPVSFLSANAGSVLLLYLCLVIGNFIGCNLYRLFVSE
ncbi:MAG: formate/nitrite transporter family protein [Paludibacteraceae bacterium]|nr:formate/nitrite transporter family protein [Paludibacteraceae bacterium]